MSNQVGDCFKFLWPFQNVRTLLNIWVWGVILGRVLQAYYESVLHVSTLEQYVQ